MGINCSEKCLYSDDGICTLSHVTNSTGQIINNCPYFRPSEEKKEKSSYRASVDGYRLED